jgi:hypothetical protein
MSFEHGHSSIHLPPRELWRHDPFVDEPLPTPVDRRDLVDTEALIHLMKTTVEPEYDWHSSFTDIHHLQWPDRWYERVNDGEWSPQVFRNLAISKLQVPRVFHNWIHRITEPPIMPKEEVMRYRIDAQRVAMSLFREVKHAKTANRRLGMDDEALSRRLMERFDTFASMFEKAKEMPVEFQLLPFDNFELRTPEDMNRIGTKLGKFAVVSSATDRVRRRLAA